MAGRLAVIGAGLMGSGIAQVAAQAGWQVTLRDLDDAATTRGLGGIRKSLEKFAEKGKIEASEVEATLGRITPTTDLEAAADADIVVEAVFERLEIKHEVFRALDKICKAGRGARHQHLGDPGHPDRRGHRAARVGRRHPLLLPGADDEALRAGPRLQDQRRDAGHRAGLRRGDRQDLRRGQPGHRRLRHHPADLRAGGGGGQAGRVRRGVAPRTWTSPASSASGTRWARWPPPT